MINHLIKPILTGFWALAILFTMALPAAAAPETAVAPAPSAIAPPTPIKESAKPAPAKPALAQAAPPKAAPAQPTSPAPAKVSATDLDKFASAIKQMLVVNQASEAEIGQVIKAEGLTDQRFREIYTVERDPQIKPAQAITPAEKGNYDRAVAKIIKIQQADESKLEKVITGQGLELKRFNEIFEIVQKDPELQKQVRQKLQG
jgi:Domain of unknown function (DUF4168)